MRQVRGAWIANKQERTEAIKILMSKGYNNSEAIDIIEKRLFEYNPLGFSFMALINRTCEKF
jgi:hypothetical protein